MGVSLRAGAHFLLHPVRPNGYSGFGLPHPPAGFVSAAVLETTLAREGLPNGQSRLFQVTALVAPGSWMVCGGRPEGTVGEEAVGIVLDGPLLSTGSFLDRFD